MSRVHVSSARLRDREVISALRRFYPEFWIEFDSRDWLCLEEDGNVKMHRAFAAFSHHVGDELAAGRWMGAAEVFKFVEQVLAFGTAHAAHAATTCFLEGIMNRIPREIPPGAAVELLGPEAKKFCRKWDAITGYRTPGLW